MFWEIIGKERQDEQYIAAHKYQNVNDKIYK